MNIYENESYINEINDFSKSIDLSFLKGKRLFIAGACGLVMSYLIDTLLSDKDFDINIIALVYTKQDEFRFKSDDERLTFVKGDVRDEKTFAQDFPHIDYVINGASIVDPKGYQERPIDTMTINLYGTKNLLDLANKHHAKFLLTSSCEIYGEADVDFIKEDYSGKLDPMLVRSCYNESKRASETLCVCYKQEKDIDVYVARLSRTFGPTQSLKDTKALSQFMMNGIKKEDIVLKSKGEQLFSYTYVQDIVSGLLCILKSGESGNAYNVCNRETLRLKDVAKIIADHVGKKVVFDLNDDAYQKGYSKATLALQDPSKLESLGWKARWTLKDSIVSTMNALEKFL